MSMFHTILDNRRLLRIGGADRVDFLQNLLTQNIAADIMPPLSAAALLTPQGKLAYDMLLWHKAEEIWLELDAAQIAPLHKKLILYRLRANVSFTEEETRIGLVWTDDASQSLPALDGFAPDPRHARLGLRGLLGMVDKADLPGIAATQQDWQAHRLTLGVPEGPEELPMGQYFPLELGFAEMAAIDFQKGCFVGQEVTSRTHRRGKLRKRLHPLVFATKAPPIGTPIIANGRVFGEILAANDQQALALLRDDAPTSGLLADNAAFARLDGLFGAG